MFLKIPYHNNCDYFQLHKELEKAAARFAGLLVLAGAQSVRDDQLF